MLEERKTLQTTEELADWYNSKYSEMGSTWQTSEEEWDKHMDFMGISRDGFTHGKLLLDVGCGDGSFVHHVTPYIAAQGIEISRRAIEYSRQKYAGLSHNIYLGNAECGMGYKVYDYITCLGSLEHVIDIDSALKFIRIALKDSGILYVYAPNEKWVHMDQCNDRRGTSEEWAELFARHGFFATRVEPLNDQTVFILVKS